MTPEEQRIAIAEACGWKNCRCDEGTQNMPPKGEPDDDFNRDVVEHSKHKPYCGFPVDPHREVLPDYLNDLNAMHEAERQALVVYKNGEKWRDYRNEYTDHLWTICAPINSKEESGWGSPDFATAAQRAQAFLRTLGLWK